MPDSMLRRLTRTATSWLAPDGESAAERRWAALNRQARHGACPCGDPVTVVRYDTTVVGSVPREVWTCARCAGASSWSAGRPAWSQPFRCGDCPGGCGSVTRIGEPEPYSWHCPKRDRLS